MQVERLSPALGARVSGIDVARLDDDTFAALREAFLRYQVIVVAGQKLAPEDQIAFSRRFGELDIHVQVSDQHPDHAELMILTTRMENGKYVGAPSAGDYWHSDLSYTPRPTLCTLLHAIELPAEGGDTAFADMYSAYETLPEETKKRLDGLKARHSYNRLRNPRVEVPEAHRHEAARRYADRSPPDAIHPVVRTHPETGRKALYVSPRFTIGLEDMDEAEAQALLDDLFDHATRPERVYRHRWRAGDLVFWDNRCLIHLACGGVPRGQVRHMHRTIVRGDVPA